MLPLVVTDFRLGCRCRPGCCGQNQPGGRAEFLPVRHPYSYTFLRSTAAVSMAGRGGGVAARLAGRRWRTVLTLISLATCSSLLLLTDIPLYRQADVSGQQTRGHAQFLLNNHGDNINKKVDVNRQSNASQTGLKYILMWNEAYGTKEYDLGFGRKPFYDNLCEETRNNSRTSMTRCLGED